MALIKEYKVAYLDALFFRVQGYLLLFLSFISVFAIISNSKLETLLPTLAIFLTPLVFLSLSRFRKNPFSIMTGVWLLIYIYVPLTYCSVYGDNYIFGPGLNIELPFSQQHYAGRYTSNLYFLFFCLLSAFLGLSIFGTGPVAFKTHQKLKSFGYIPIIILAVVCFYILYDDILTSLIAKANSTGRGEGLIKFIFFDHAFLILAGSLLLSLSGRNERQTRQQITISAIIAAIFFALSLLAGSKAGWIQIGFLYFLMPYSFLRTTNDRSILFLSIPTIIFCIILAPILYFAVFFYRISLTSDVSFDLFYVVSNVDFSTLGYLTEEIFNRLAIGGFDRFMLVSTSFLELNSQFYAFQEFMPYLYKNGANLLLPGTPYPEAYAPSSQMLPNVINMQPLDGGLSEAYLMTSINSQPYTIFGIFTILFGLFSPLVIFLYHALLTLIFALSKNFIIRLTLIYFYQTAIASFGFEVAIAYGVHVLISFGFMYMFLNMISMIRLGNSNDNSLVSVRRRASS